MKFNILTTTPEHIKYASEICQMIEISAKERGTGIAKRTKDYIKGKILDGKAVIALQNDEIAGFCYIESWSHGKFVANSGLIVKGSYRGHGLGKKIKETILKLSKKKYPSAKIFGITTSLAVMKINSSLGYKPVTFSELTDDDTFWEGCKSCANYDILKKKNRKICLCTGMIYDPSEKKQSIKNKAVDKIKKSLGINPSSS